ncbi:MAG TPA: hypothetical protein VJH94_02855 [Candidatus Paceibacterota bacterium]
MVAQKDTFWKIFGSIVGGFLLLLCFGILWLKISYLHQPDDVSLAEAVEVTFDPTRDPFEKAGKNEKNVALVSGFLYRDSLPFGFEDWSWDSIVDWRSSMERFEGAYSLHAAFLKPWAGIRLNIPDQDVSSYRSLSLAVFPDSAINDLYLEFHDTFGRSLGRQSLAWYAESGVLIPNTWNTISIPLENLVTAPAEKTKITGFSISVENPGSVFLDAIRLETSPIAHARWSEPEGKPGLGQDPFAGMTQVDLPYTLSSRTEDVAMWQPLFGQFEKTNNGVLIGPIPKKTNGSMTVFGGGKEWANYRVNANVYWGMTSTFSILVRFIDDGNFVACAYSNYGAVIQIYQVKKGASTLLGQTPLLAIRTYKPWGNAKHGASVQGNKVSCYMDGEKVLSATLSGMPATGSVGIETWSINSDDYPHVLQELHISSL